MKLLFVTATSEEAQGAGLLPSTSRLKAGETAELNGTAGSRILVTGVGGVATAFHLARHLAGHQYDLAINIGIAGSFTDDLSPGSVAVVEEDCFADMGSEDRDRFLSVFDLGFIGPDEPPFTSGRIRPLQPPGFNLPDMPHAKAISVNKVHGRQESIQEVLHHFPGRQLESMEGAAFFYACNLSGQPSLQIRAVSNYVEPRNRDAWKIAEALTALREVVRVWIP